MMALDILSVEACLASPRAAIYLFSLYLFSCDHLGCLLHFLLFIKMISFRLKDGTAMRLILIDKYSRCAAQPNLWKSAVKMVHIL